MYGAARRRPGCRGASLADICYEQPNLSQAEFPEYRIVPSTRKSDRRHFRALRNG